MTDIALPGFADPVAGSQHCFRAVLDAMARPGTIHRTGEALSPPAPLDRATAAVLLTLVDAEAALFIADEMRAAGDWLAFHCGASFVREAECAFALCAALPELSRFSAGTDLAPEDSTTVVLQLPAIGLGRRYRVSGPGLRVPGTIALDGLPAAFAEIWRGNHALFPRGIDLILCAGTQLAALPRSCTIEAC
jgi:alpha-D-ribose 1-methylphosphonate 5-triphosphate synthase subunit PhnH